MNTALNSIFKVTAFFSFSVFAVIYFCFVESKVVP